MRRLVVLPIILVALFVASLFVGLFAMSSSLHMMQAMFFVVLGDGTGRDAYAHAFGVAQAATSAALAIAMVLSVPRRRMVRSR